MGRTPCCDKGVNRGAWSVKEDEILVNFIKLHGEGKWRDISKRAGLNRCGKSCRLRWLNYLRPDIKRGKFSEAEEDLIVRLHKLLGNRWSLIAGRLPGRTDNDIKNFWNTNLSKRAHQNHTHNNKTSHPITTNSPTTLTSAHHHQNTKISSFNATCRPPDSSSQPIPVIRAKPARLTKKIIFPKSNGVMNSSVTWEAQNETTASASDPAAEQGLMNHCLCSSGFIEDFDVDDALLTPQLQVPEINIDHNQVNDFENCVEENSPARQNWMVGQLFESADEDHEEAVDFSFLNVTSDPFMDLDPSCLDGIRV